MAKHDAVLLMHLIKFVVAKPWQTPRNVTSLYSSAIQLAIARTYQRTPEYFFIVCIACLLVLCGICLLYQIVTDISACSQVIHISQ